MAKATRGRPKRAPLPPRSQWPGLPWRDATVAWLLFALLLTVYLSNGDVIPGADAVAIVYQPVSLLNEGNLSFAPSEMPFMFTWQLHTPEGARLVHVEHWREQLGGQTARALYRAGQLKPRVHKYYVAPSTRTDPTTGERLFISTFPPGAGLTALPVLLLARIFAGDLRERPWALWYGAKLAASLLAAGSAAIVYLAARRLVEQRHAAVAALAYGLGTCLWSVSSQTLWQHASDAFFLALGTYFLLRTRESPRLAAYCGLAYGCAVLCRVTSAGVVVAVAVYLLVTDRKALLWYVLGGIPAAIFLGAYNLYYLGSPLAFGETGVGNRLALAKAGTAGLWQTPLWLGTAGLLISPSRGLLVFSPFLIFALPGAYVAWRRRELAALRPLSVAVVMVILIHAKHYDWWGGWSYGYRHIGDLTVLLAMFLAVVMPWIVGHRWALATFGVLLAWSVVVQFVGAFAYDMHSWDGRLVGYKLRVAGQSEPVIVKDAAQAAALVSQQQAQVVEEIREDIDLPQYRHRLWSLTDNQILYYMTHFGESRRAKREYVKVSLQAPN